MTDTDNERGSAPHPASGAPLDQPPVRLLISGSREAGGPVARQFIADRIRAFVEVQTRPVTVIHGGARGVDSIAGKAAAELGCAVEVFDAQWERFGRGAGHVRNVEMADSGVHYCLAFTTKPLQSSRGTADMVKVCKERGIPGRVVKLYDSLPTMRSPF